MVEYLGLERLTNAFGLSTVAIGIAGIIASPVNAKVVAAVHGDVACAFAVSGVCLFLSGLILILVAISHRKQMKKKRRRNLNG